MSCLKTFLNGIIKENPVLVMLLGTCPTLAVTTTAANGLGMGITTMFALVFSNVAISLLKGLIPRQVRLPCYIVIVAGFVTFLSFMLQIIPWLYWLYESLGLFLPLIAVNCIIFERAEAFASKNNPFISLIDGLGMGAGFTLALFVMGSAREILGSGSWMGLKIPMGEISPMMIFGLPAGGFFMYGIIIAFVGKITKKPPRAIGCEGCPSRGVCKDFAKGGDN
ncbi:MAG: electron transport complex subunit RsxE [Oscillospiraceae bacterium]|jgi:electron transport complex protein RnfE|nr:electron transport complex subunit RsxE [Oscillospiraceae bacterium]